MVSLGNNLPSNAAAASALRSDLRPVQAQRITRFHKRLFSGASPRHLNPDTLLHRDLLLRANAPVRDRVFRTTRATLRVYRDQGRLPDSTVIW